MSLNKIKKTLTKHCPTFIKNIIKYFLNDIRNFIDFIKSPFLLIKEKNKKKKWLSLEEIKDYRKNIKIYDIFTFFNELDLLEIRLNILDSYVDYFVIIEATETFSGLPKKLYFEENKDLFKKWEHKIIHYVIKDTPINEDDLRKRLENENINKLDKQIIINNLTSDNVPKGEIHWLKEFYQKESIKKALISLDNDDFCFISDVDEIWNPELLIDYSKDDIFKLKQVAYFYFLNNRSNDNWKDWTGTVATKYKKIKDTCLNHLRTDGKTKYTTLNNGGWHFTFQGGSNNVNKKLESYGHQEINTTDIKSKMKTTISKNKDIRGRRIKFWIDNNNLPEYIKKNRNKYKDMFRN